MMKHIALVRNQPGAFADRLNLIGSPLPLSVGAEKNSWQVADFKRGTKETEKGGFQFSRRKKIHVYFKQAKEINSIGKKESETDEHLVDYLVVFTSTVDSKSFLSDQIKNEKKQFPEREACRERDFQSLSTTHVSLLK